MKLKDMHLADLHDRARELDVPNYRLLPRDELIDAIEERDGKAEEREDAPEEQEPKRGGRKSEPVEEAETEPVTGVLDRMPQGYGFLRLEGLETAEGDVYVSASQIRRCELRPGDEVAGPARAPRRGERHRALVRVESVNGGDPEGKRTAFEDLTPKAPHREMPGLDSVGLREPALFGQRTLVRGSAAEAARELLQGIAGALAGSEAQLTVLLAGASADDVGSWESAAKDADLIGGSEEIDPRDRVRSAELAMGRAKRRVESGEDVVVLIDSLSSLAEGYRDVSRVKRLFGSGRELGEEGTGSLTVFAAVVADDERAEDVESALEGTEDARIELDPR